MDASNLPIWYPLQSLGQSVHFEPTPEEREKYIENRVGLLSAKTNRDFKRSIDETKEAFQNRAIEERKAFTLLKMGVALDPRLSSWLVEVEGDLFQDRFMNVHWEEKKVILDELFPPDAFGPIWLTLDELSDYLEEDLRKSLKIIEDDKIKQYTGRSNIRSYTRIDPVGNTTVIGIDYRYASFLLKNRKARIYKGWVIGTIDKLSTTIKHRFERLLDQDLVEIGTRLETSSGGDVKRLAQEINEYLSSLVKTRRDYDFTDLRILGEFEENFQLYPPCIQDLLNLVNNVGYIAHWERFQLGLFLKHTGMPVEDQLQFWYSKAVDNINMSFNEFSKKAGYIIRHIYGLEGGKIDYDMPSCGTIQNKMYCSFRHQGIDTINDRIRTYMHSLDGDQQAIKGTNAREVSDRASKGFTTLACAKYLELTCDRRVENIIHPLQYLREAALSKGKLVEKEDEPPEEETPDE